MLIDNKINHIVFVVDKSASMGRLQEKVISVFDSQVRRLASRSTELDQETRVSVYVFSHEVECVVYDKDVLRLPSLRQAYRVGGNTALLDATDLAITDLKKTPELYGEHSFLIYVITDGEENCSRNTTPAKLSALIKSLPDHWTLAAFVPNSVGVHEAKQCGFPADNISVWGTTTAGLEEVGEQMFRATDNFMANRAKGIRGTRSLFAFDTKSVTKKAVRRNLDAIDPSMVKVIPVKRADNESQIRDLVEKYTRKAYVKGSAYYQLTKKETVQSTKNVCLREISTGKIYTGDSVREMLGLPDYEVRVEPAKHPAFTFFVQSTSVNRKVFEGTEVLVLK